MGRFLVAALLAVCVSYASAMVQSWTSWSLRDECVCDSSGRGMEYWQRDCFGTCSMSYEEQQRPCQCGVVLTPGEISGIVVGSVVFLILIIIILIWCCACCGCCGCDDWDCMDCGCMGGSGGGCCRMSRYDSDEDLYRGKVGRAQMMNQMPMQGQPQVYVTSAPQMQPQMQVRVPQAVNFGGAVVQQSTPAVSYYVG